MDFSVVLECPRAGAPAVQVHLPREPIAQQRGVQAVHLDPSFGAERWSKHGKNDAKTA